MNPQESRRDAMLALTGRPPGDAIVQATLGQQLKVVGIHPSTVLVAHAATGLEVTNGWFTNVRHFGRGGFARRHGLLLVFVAEELRKRDYSTLYARDTISMLTALIARRLSRSKSAVIFDCRGDIAAESRLKGAHRFRVGVLGCLQQFAWRRADRVMVVSEALGERLGSRAGSSAYVVVPNLQPDCLSTVNDLPDRPFVVFAGGGQAWQGAEEALRYLAQLAGHGIDVEVVSRDGGVLEIARRFGLSVSSGNRQHVLSRLQRATASWIVRDSSSANSVASPVKLGEALAAGAIVIGSSDTWENMDELERDGLAFVWRGSRAIEDLVPYLFEVWSEGVTGRERRLATVQRKWTLYSYRSELESFFGRRA